MQMHLCLPQAVPLDIASHHQCMDNAVASMSATSSPLDIDGPPSQHHTAKRLPGKSIQKAIKDWIIKSLQKLILLHDFSDFIEVFDFLDGFIIQSQSDYDIILDQISLCQCMDNGILLIDQ